MIVINSGKMLIPEEERFVGFAGDNLHSTKQFLVKDIADENCIYRLYLNFDDGTTNYFVLDSKVADGSTLLTWNVLSEHIFKSGIVNAQIKAFLESGEIFHTSWDYFLVAPSAESAPPFKESENAEFLEYERKLNELLSQIDNGMYVPASRTIAGLDLSKNIAVRPLIEALGTYPILFSVSAPDERFPGYEKQLCVSGIATDTVILYVCGGKYDDGTYIWKKLSVDVSTEVISQLVNEYFIENPVEVKDGIDGKDGTDGKSAYEVALDNGFKGSEQKWLESLKGKDGETPGIGIVNMSENPDYGIDGHKISFETEEEVQWFIVKNGEKGDKGDKGDTGAQGPQGETGATGANGLTPRPGGNGNWFIGSNDTGVAMRGEKGDKGDTGAQGPKGDTGATGAKGQDGYTPIKGTDYFTDEDKAEIVDTLVDETGLLSEVSYNEITNNLNDSIYEYGYLNETGGNYNDFTPISTTFRTQNFIPVEGGKTLCWNGKAINLTNSSFIRLAQYDANKNCIVNRTDVQIEHNKWTNHGITLNENTRYVRFTVYLEVADLSSVQINLFYYENRADMWSGAGDTFNFVPHFISESMGEYVPHSKVQSPLTGKKIIYDGDSIAESRLTHANNGGGYAKLIADKVGGKYENFAVGGARLTTKPSDKTYHSVVDNLTNLPLDGDLYCFEGGINDYWTPKALGTFSKTDFTGTLDTNTICGALETIFRYALNTFVGKPIVFVITHKIQSTAYAENTNGDTFEDYRNAMVGICEKYSIPYYDAFSKSGLNGWNSVQDNAFLTANTNGTGDGCHPNEEGYKRYYVPQLISLFESVINS